MRRWNAGDMPPHAPPPRWRQLASLLLCALLLLNACDLAPTPPKPVPGALRWRVQIADTQRATPVFVAHGLVYLAGADHAVYALDAATGKQHWRTELGVAAGFVSAVADGAVYVMALDQAPYAYAIYALDATTGAKRWHIQTRQSPSVDAAVANGLVYFGEWSGPVFALDAATGAQRWQGDGANQYAAPAVANGTLYDVSKIDNGAVVALDAATGAERWQVQAGDRIVSAPMAANGVVYVASTESDHHVYALDAKTGALRWRYEISGPYFAPIAANGLAYVASKDGFLYALNA
jgi:eukaryotic-like serine/threonine-protein kinase